MLFCYLSLRYIETCFFSFFPTLFCCLELNLAEQSLRGSRGMGRSPAWVHGAGQGAAGGRGLSATIPDGLPRLCFQIRRHPSFKRFLHKLSDSSLRKLAATLERQKAHPAEPEGHLTERTYHFAFGSSNRFAGNESHAVLRLMGLCYGHSQHSYAHFPCQVAQQVRTSGNRLQIPTGPGSLAGLSLPHAEFLTFGVGLTQMSPPCRGPVRCFNTHRDHFFPKTLTGLDGSSVPSLFGSGP